MWRKPNDACSHCLTSGAHDLHKRSRSEHECSGGSGQHLDPQDAHSGTQRIVPCTPPEADMQTAQNLSCSRPLRKRCMGQSPAHDGRGGGGRPHKKARPPPALRLEREPGQCQSERGPGLRPDLWGTRERAQPAAPSAGKEPESARLEQRAVLYHQQSWGGWQAVGNHDQLSMLENRVTIIHNQIPGQNSGNTLFRRYASPPWYM